ncbi:tetratricopeptide repeat protein [bacterium]|nr:tetratricopeptide repeat protein [bacterium]
MKNKKKMCVLLMIAVLGVCSIKSEVYANDDVENAATDVVQVQKDDSQEQETEEIKGNREALEKAKSLMAKKDFQAAITYLNAYITSKPKKYEGYKYRGDAFYALRQYSLAQKDYQTAVDLKADDDKFVTGTKVISAVVLGADKEEQLQNAELGNLYGRLMYAQKALNDPAYEASYSKAVKYNSHIYLPQPKKNDITRINCPQKYGKVLNPLGVDSYIYGAIEDIENSKFKDAEHKSQYLISNYPEYYMGYYLNGVALSGLDKDEDAILAFETALKYNPYDFESLASLGLIYYNKIEQAFSVSDSKKSIEYFEKALKYNPNCNSYYLYMGMNALQAGRNTSAIASFNNAIKLKSNDYNSMYYKLIAQYLNEDYSDVTDGAANLLYKHVSNYNSVLYLRALAYYKMGSYDLALEDLDMISNSVNDIFNMDLKTPTDSEKSLESYVYYLKAQIMQKKGFGAKSDLIKAYENPIIAKLSQLEKAIVPYVKPFSGRQVLTADYEKYNNFYNNELPKLLTGNIEFSEDDIENQYDYIRTTFANVGIGFKKENDSYKLAIIEGYPQERYLSKLQQETSVVANASETINSEKPVLRANSLQEEVLLEDNQMSIAQMLATNSLAAVSSKQTEIPVEKIIKPVQEEKLPEKIVEVETLNDTVLAKESESIVLTEKDVVSAVAPIKEKTTKKVEKKSKVESVKIIEETVSEAKTDLTENVADHPEVSDVVIPAVEEKTKSIVEKHAKVDSPKVVIEKKEIPEIDDSMDVVVLEPQNSLFMAAKTQIQQESFNIKYPAVEQVVTNNEEVIANSDDNVITSDDSPVILPETESELDKKQEGSVAVPIVIVPELEPKSSEEIEETQQIHITEVNSELEQSNVLAMRPTIEPEKFIETSTKDTIVVSEPVETKADKVKKEKKVKTEKVKKETELNLVDDVKDQLEKPVKIKKEKTIKEKKTTPIEEKPLKVKKEKAVKQIEPQIVETDTDAIESVDVVSQKKEKRVKPKKEKKTTEKEMAIDSIVQSALGTAEDSVEDKPIVEPEVVQNEEEKPVSLDKADSEHKSFWAKLFGKKDKNDELAKTKPEKVKKEKIKKVKESKSDIKSDIDSLEQFVNTEDKVIDIVDDSIEQKELPVSDAIVPLEKPVKVKKERIKKSKSKIKEQVLDVIEDPLPNLLDSENNIEVEEIPVSFDEDSVETKVKNKKKKVRNK